MYGVTMLRITNVSVVVSNKRVVKKANLELHRNEINLLLGPNGSGKSSLLNAIAGLPRYRVVSGSIMMNGMEIKDLDPCKRVELGIALAVQHPPKLRGIRVRMLLEKILSRSIKERSEIDKEIRRIAKLLSIERLLDREFGIGFSGGELKRIELATVIALRPRIALIDEPDSGVDVDSVLLMANAIEDMVREGTESVLVVTHTGFIARHLKHDRAYVMLDGEIVAEGPSNIILNQVLEKGFSSFKVKHHE